MERIPKGKYTKEFREEAVKPVLENGLSAGEASRRLSLAKSTPENWSKASKSGKLKETGSSYRKLSETELDLHCLASIESGFQS